MDRTKYASSKAPRSGTRRYVDSFVAQTTILITFFFTYIHYIYTRVACIFNFVDFYFK